MQSRHFVAALVVGLLLIAPVASARAVMTCEIRALERPCVILAEGPGDPPGVNPPADEPGVPDPSVPTLPAVPVPSVPGAPSIPAIPPISIPGVPALPPMPAVPGVPGLPDLPDPGTPSGKAACGSLPTSSIVRTNGLIPSVDDLNPRAECEANFR